MGRDFLITGVFGLLHLAAIGEESPLVLQIIEDIDFDVFLGFGDGQVIRGIEQFLHFLAVVVALILLSHPAPATATRVASARIAASGVAAAHAPVAAVAAVAVVVGSGFLHLSLPIVTVVPIELPASKDRRSRLHRRFLN